MLLQEQMIDRVRVLCRADQNLDAAMMYGSFTYGEGDEYSDIEFLLFFDDNFFPRLDRQHWIEQIASVGMIFVNEFGITTVIFDNLIRAGFHFHAISEVTIAQAWQGQISFPRLDSSLLVDKSGKLTPYLEPLIGPPPDRNAPANIQFIVDCFINWSLFGNNVLRRGEYARALELLGILQRHLLWMVRVLETRTEHWPTPSRLLEHDLSSAVNARFQACTAPLEQEALWRAYRSAWSWGREMIGDLHTRYNLKVSETICASIDSRFD